MSANNASKVTGPLMTIVKWAAIVAAVYFAFKLFGPATDLIDAASNSVGSILDTATAALNEMASDV